MDLESLKKQFIKDELGISNDFGNIFTFVDFANVNNWFRDDRQNSDDSPLAENEKITIDLEALKIFLEVFSNDIRFYYGHNPSSSGSMSFLYKTKEVFGKSRTFTKPIQWVRHHVAGEELETNTRSLFKDSDGLYVRLPKSNFDVEIAVDAMKLMNRFDTICLLSGDADFAYLNTYLRTKGKRVILIKGGHITHQLKQSVDVRINAQNIKKYITHIMQKPGG